MEMKDFRSESFKSPGSVPAITAGNPRTVRPQHSLLRKNVLSSRSISAINFSDLSEWLRSNSIKVDDAFRTVARRKLFRDAQGVARFADTWEEADLEEVEAQRLGLSNESFVDTTGGMELSISVQRIDAASSTATEDSRSNEEASPLVPADILDNSDSASSNTRAVRLIVDFQHLWRYLEENEDDELAIHAPLLSAYVKFLFHPKTVRIMHCLTVYNTIILFSVNVLEASTSAFADIFNALYFPAAWLLYMSVLYLFCANTHGVHRQSSPSPSSLTGKLPVQEEHYYQQQQQQQQQQHHDTLRSRNISTARSTVDKDDIATGIGFGAAGNERSTVAMKRRNLHWTASLKQLRSKFSDELRIFGRWCMCSSKSRSPDRAKQHLRHRDNHRLSAHPRCIHRENDNLANNNEEYRLKSRISFYELMNTSLKFLTRHTGLAVQEIDFNRAYYRRMLVISIFPFFIYYLVLIGSDILFIVLFCFEDSSGSDCVGNVVLLVSSVGFMTFVLQMIIVFTAAMVAMTGLAYGAEIAFRLSDSWFRRFSSLRRISSDRQVSDFKFTMHRCCSRTAGGGGGAHPVSLTLSQTDTVDHGQCRAGRGTGNAEKSPMYTQSDRIHRPEVSNPLLNTAAPSSVSCAGIAPAAAPPLAPAVGAVDGSARKTLLGQRLIHETAVVQENGDISSHFRPAYKAAIASMDSSKPVVHHTVSAVMSSLQPSSNSGQREKKGEKRVVQEQEEQEEHIVVQQEPLDAAVLMTYIKRDSFEHYLFLREYMDHSSRTWSPLLLGIFLGAGYYFMGYLFDIFIEKTSIILIVYSLFWGLLVIGVLFIYPVVSLAHANSFSSLKLLSRFKHAAPEDYSVIGGNELWMSFLAQSPAVWTFFGVWVTWERINVVCSSLVVSVVGGLLTITTAKYGFSGNSSG